jgi:hypothetical protein
MAASRVTSLSLSERPAAALFGSRVAPPARGGIAASPHLQVPGSRKAGRRLATMPAAAVGATLRPASLLEKGR